MKKSELRDMIKEELLREASSIQLSEVPADKLKLLKKVGIKPTEA